jgi:hypothetical protein
MDFRNWLLTPFNSEGGRLFKLKKGSSGAPATQLSYVDFIAGENRFYSGVVCDALCFDLGV